MHNRTVGQVVSVLALVLALSAPAAAQTPGPGTGSTGVLFGAGISFLRVPEGIDIEDDSTTFNGVAVDFRKNIYSTPSIDLGIVGDIGYHRKTEEFLDISASASTLTLMGGVRVTASQLDRVAPFGQFLVGMVQSDLGGDVCDIDEIGEEFCEAETDGVIGFGGGIDVRLTDRLNFRGQIDFLRPLVDEGEFATRFMFGISLLLGGS